MGSIKFILMLFYLAGLVPWQGSPLPIFYQTYTLRTCGTYMHFEHKAGEKRYMDYSSKKL
ncbi:MAG: hypothetical protein D6730_19495 [Bacteroidetes bacterium]|nr:MAG: hypothetical protein D6730_19495 [Bacteroidota bacterium]